jgi:hypothetical protein
MLKTNNNEVVTAESSATLYYSKNLNDTVTFVVFRGKYTDNVYKIQAMQ